MKKKELKKFASMILSLEQIIETNEDPIEVKKAKEKIISLSGKIDPEDMIAIDELIQKEISEKS